MPSSDEPQQSAGDSSETTTRTPRWVIVSGIVVAVLIVAFVILHLAGGGLVGHVPPTGGH